MAENIRGINEILDELFKGKRDSAMAKLQKVSHTYCQMCLWCDHRVPLSDIDKDVKSYFFFLNANTFINKNVTGTPITAAKANTKSLFQPSKL